MGSLMSSNFLRKRSSLFGIRVWLLLLISLVAFIFLSLLFITLLCITSFLRHRKRMMNNNANAKSLSLDKRLLSRRAIEIEMNMPNYLSSSSLSQLSNHHHIHISPFPPDRTSSSDHIRLNSVPLKEIELVTNGFSRDNVVGIGAHGVVYRGILLDTRRVAVKTLHSNMCCQAEQFIAEAERMGHVRHKNLVKLLGYCMEGGYRILVNEYVDNGNLHRWLHEFPQQLSPLTWKIRMNIIQGIAKALAYLHEDTEPKIIHQDLKSSNVLLDHQWDPKISDFAIAKLFDDPCWNDPSYSGGGYTAEGDDGVLDEMSDIYSFGILIMEIICGRPPVNPQQPQAYLIDWLKLMVANQKMMNVVDPKLTELPSSKEVKRIILVALRCVDPDTENRPTMGDVIHMLQPQDLLLTNPSINK